MALVTIAGWSLAVAVAYLALGLRRRLELVARADHELRGPIAAIGLAFERVRRGDSGMELAAALDSQLDRLRAGLGDLQAARSGARRPSRPEPIPLERQVRAAAAGWEPLAGRLGRPLRLDWRAGSVTVAADRGGLAQALGNLISNAVEHGDGAIEVRGHRVGGAVRIEVGDDGPRGGAGGGPEGRRAALNGAEGRSGGGAGAGASLPGRAARPPRPAPFRSLSARHGRGLSIASHAAREAGGRLEIASSAGRVTAALELPADEA